MRRVDLDSVRRGAAAVALAALTMTGGVAEAGFEVSGGRGARIEAGSSGGVWIGVGGYRSSGGYRGSYGGGGRGGYGGRYSTSRYRGYDGRYTRRGGGIGAVYGDPYFYRGFQHGPRLQHRCCARIDNSRGHGKSGERRHGHAEERHGGRRD